MRLTESQLKKIIKEEITNLFEQFSLGGAFSGDPGEDFILTMLFYIYQAAGERASLKNINGRITQVKEASLSKISEKSGIDKEELKNNLKDLKNQEYIETRIKNEEHFYKITEKGFKLLKEFPNIINF